MHFSLVTYSTPGLRQHLQRRHLHYYHFHNWQPHLVYNSFETDGDTYPMICMFVSWHVKWHRTKVSAVELPLGLWWTCNLCRDVLCYSVGFELVEVARSMPDDKWRCNLVLTRACAGINHFNRSVAPPEEEPHSRLMLPSVLDWAVWLWVWHGPHMCHSQCD